MRLERSAFRVCAESALTEETAHRCDDISSRQKEAKI